MTAVHAQVDEAVDRYLASVDRALPGRVRGFYVVGSVALGAFQPGRSDIDFVAIVDRPLSRDELVLLEDAEHRLYRSALVRAVSSLPWRWPLVCNGVYVLSEDVARSPLEVVPMASHVSGRFRAGRAFDVNPVTWRILGESGIAVRGVAPAQLGIRRDDSELRDWILGNLNGYWRNWAGALRRPRLTAAKALLLRYVAWGVLGTSRMHFTIATGRIASKRQACDYALDVFESRWRPLLEDARAYWTGDARAKTRTPPLSRPRLTSEYVLAVIDSAAALASRETPPIS